MNRNIALAFVFAAAAAGNALADDITIAPPFTSTLTRAQVQAELQQAGRPAMDPWDGYNQLAQFRSDRSRADVRNEYIRERDSVAAFTGEDSGAMYLARREMPRRDGQHLAALPKTTE